MRKLMITAAVFAAFAADGASAQQTSVAASPPTNDTGSARYQGNSEGAGSTSGISRRAPGAAVSTGSGKLSSAQRQGRATATGNSSGIGRAPQANRPVLSGNSSTHANPLGQDLSNPTAAGQAGANGNGAGVQR